MEPLNVPNDSPLTPEQLEQINTLKTIANLEDDTQAKQYLEMCDWNLEQAVNFA